MALAQLLQCLVYNLGFCSPSNIAHELPYTHSLQGQKLLQSPSHARISCDASKDPPLIDEIPVLLSHDYATFPANFGFFTAWNCGDVDLESCLACFLFLAGRVCGFDDLERCDAGDREV